MSTKWRKYKRTFNNFYSLPHSQSQLTIVWKNGIIRFPYEKLGGETVNEATSLATHAHHHSLTHTHTHSHTLTLTHTHTRIRTHTYTHTHTHTHTHSHIHIHTHTYTQFSGADPDKLEAKIKHFLWGSGAWFPGKGHR